MMKRVFAAVAATMLMMTTVGQGLALTLDQQKLAMDVTLDENPDDAMQIAKIGDEAGEAFYIATDNDLKKLDEAMQQFSTVGGPMPDGTVMAFVTSSPDEDGDYMVWVFGEGGKHLGQAYINEGVRIAVLDYVEAGI